MDRSSRQKISKETQVLNDTLDETDLIDISRTFHPSAEEDIPSKCRRVHIILKCTRNISRIDHILVHKSNLSKFLKVEIISSIFSDDNAVRLDINYKKEKK